jgi:uncharacterized coiled-coil DUF342 family protein
MGEGSAMSDEEFALLESAVHDGDMTGYEQERLLAEAVRLREWYKRLASSLFSALRDRDEAVAHRDGYETRCIEQGIEIRNLRLEVKRLEKKLRGSTEAYSGLLADARNDRDEARDIACKLLRIAEARGPRVFGPRPDWLKYEP